MKENEFIDQFVVNQLMLGNLPTRAFHFTCQSLNLSVSYADHLFHAESVVSVLIMLEFLLCNVKTFKSCFKIFIINSVTYTLIVF